MAGKLKHTGYEILVAAANFADEVAYVASQTDNPAVARTRIWGITERYNSDCPFLGYNLEVSSDFHHIDYSNGTSAEDLTALPVIPGDFKGRMVAYAYLPPVIPRATGTLALDLALVSVTQMRCPAKKVTAPAVIITPIPFAEINFI